MLIAKYSRTIPHFKEVSPYLPKPKMLLLSMDSKLLSSMHNAHINTYVELAFTKSQSGEIFTFYLQIRVFKSFFVCLHLFYRLTRENLILILSEYQSPEKIFLKRTIFWWYGIWHA